MQQSAVRDYDCIQPVYVGRFQCDGRLCDSLCCRYQWDIQFDAKSYERYRRLQEDPVWTDRMARELTWEPEMKCHVFHHSDPDGCSFLREDKLCALQRALGEEVLVDACAEYPRKTHLMPDVLERALCLTCPAAAKEALLAKEPMQFEQVKLSSHRESYFQRADNAEMIRAICFYDLQWTGIAILQERRLKIPERMRMLGDFLKQAEDLVQAGRGEQIGALGEAFPAEQMSSQDSLRTVTPDGDMETVWRMLSYVTQKSEDDSEETSSYISRGRSFLAKADAVPEAERLLSVHEHMLEHYLVNEYFMELYPCAFMGSFTENYRVFLSLYRMLRFLLLGVAAERGALAEQDVLDAVRWMSLRTNHYMGFMEALQETADG